MNDSELNGLLRRARVPDYTDAKWRQLAGDTMRSLAAFGESEIDLHASRMAALSPDVSARRPRRAPLLLGLGLAAACVFAGFVFGHWHSRQNVRADQIANARKLFAELSAMFPNQLEAVVLDGSTPRLVLMETSSMDQDVPIFVRFCSGKGCQRVITFSGRRVPLNGEMWEVLLDARGGVIVTGEHFAWSSGEGTSAGGYRIEAAPLVGAL